MKFILIGTTNREYFIEIAIAVEFDNWKFVGSDLIADATNDFRDCNYFEMYKSHLGDIKWKEATVLKTIQTR